MILTVLLSGSYLTMKMAHGLWWGHLVLPPLSGETCVWYLTVWKQGKEGGRGKRRGKELCGFRAFSEGTAFSSLEGDNCGATPTPPHQTWSE